jgi:hypothetical protein
METEKQIPIWFFIGAILAVYGVLIFVAGVYELIFPPEHKVALYDWHADLWWGALMVIAGVFYCVRFHPGKHNLEK